MIAAAINHGVTVLAWARVDGVSPSTEEPSTACCDDVIVDGDIITGENADAQASASDSEWKYVPVRRMASADTDAADDADHDILYDPEDDLLPPARPVGDEEPTPAFDGRLLTAEGPDQGIGSRGIGPPSKTQLYLRGGAFQSSATDDRSGSVPPLRVHK